MVGESFISQVDELDLQHLLEEFIMFSSQFTAGVALLIVVAAIGWVACDLFRNWRESKKEEEQEGLASPEKTPCQTPNFLLKRKDPSRNWLSHPTAPPPDDDLATLPGKLIDDVRVASSPRSQGGETGAPGLT